MAYVVEHLDTLRWEARDGSGVTLGEARGWMRPDRRCVVRLPVEAPAVWCALAAALSAEARAPLLVSVPPDAGVRSSALADAGFRAVRRDQHWLIPVSSVLARLSHAAGHRDHHDASDNHADDDTRCSHAQGDHTYDLVSARHTDLERLCALDNEIRGDIPGTAGWVGTVTALADSLDDDEFDPDLYLVARRRADGAYVGLIRVWNRRPHPRVGCLGVVRSHRRTSLCLQLVVAVGTTLADRGVDAVTTETDLRNAASHTMARRMGAEPTDVSTEWEYPEPLSLVAAARAD